MSLSPGAAYDGNRNKRLLQKNADSHYDQVAHEDETDFNMNASESLSAPSAKR